MFSFSNPNGIPKSQTLKTQIANLKTLILNHEKKLLWCGDKLKEIHSKIENSGEEKVDITFDELNSLETGREVLHETILEIERRIKDLNAELNQKMKDLYFEEHQEIQAYKKDESPTKTSSSQSSFKFPSGFGSFTSSGFSFGNTTSSGFGNTTSSGFGNNNNNNSKASGFSFNLK